MSTPPPPPKSQPFDQTQTINPMIYGVLSSRIQRYRLLAKARWLFLALATLYCTVSGLAYTFSTHGWFLVPRQFYGMLAVFLFVLVYNSLYSFFTDLMARKQGGNYLQVGLDYVSVAALVYFTGGAASWFWPITLLVTFEASILMTKRVKVFTAGMLGGLCFGGVLVAQHKDLLPYFDMPFIDAELHHHGLYLFLLWLLVSLLNASLAIAGSYLMGVIRKTHSQVQAAEIRQRTFLDQANDLIFSLTPQGDFLFTNQMFQRTLGYSAATTRNLNISDVLEPGIRRRFLAEARKIVSGERTEPLEGRFVTVKGAFIEIEGMITPINTEFDRDVIWVVCRDVSLRKRTEEQLYHLAHHDQLTGLPNRMAFADRLRQAIAISKRQQQLCAVLYLDLDRFKIINDSLGHAVGDALLKETARRLRSCVREVDTVARLGGDEFAMVLVNLRDSADACGVAEKVLKSLAKPVSIDTHELFITTSIGISLYPQHSEESEILVKNADVAMYQAKALGRNNYQLYELRMDTDTEHRMALENGLRTALEHDELQIFYQPKIDAESGRVTAVEALIRWQHPELGLLPPAEFIAIAEETGLIHPIGEWVLRKACQQNRAWQEQGLPKVRVAINLSGFQLQQPTLLDMVSGVLEESGLAGEYLEFEITETVIMQNPEFATGILSRMRDLDIHISIDDFGTGYSSLTHLKRFSINTLKIDRTFVRDIELSSANAAIATALIAMGSSLNLKVIAEGVETAGQFTMLKERQCDEMQGYLFSHPLPAAEMAEFLRGGNATLPTSGADQRTS